MTEIHTIEENSAHPTLPSNVRLIGWKDGYHIYAKVDNEDVTDEYGNQKWSTVKEAVSAIEWYLKEYSNNTNIK